MAEHAELARIRDEAERAAVIYNETLPAVQAASIGATERRLHSALGDLVHVALYRPAEGGDDRG